MTTEEVISGLEGVLACESQISYIDGFVPELTFRGYQIQDVATKLSFEQVVYLLWHDEVLRGPALEEFQGRLAEQRALPEEVIRLLRLLPAGSAPMVGLRTAASLLGALDADADRIDRDAVLGKAASLTAKFATIVAAQARLQAGQEPIAPDPSLGHAANFYRMLTGQVPDETTQRTLDAVLVLYAEHETNASTFACRVVAGTESDFYSAICAGIGALKGPLHGGAIDEAMRMLLEIGSPERAPAYVDEALAARRKLPGFGHRVYRAGDPRASVLKEMVVRSAESAADSHWLEVAEATERRMREAKNIIPNVDYYASIVLHQLGFPLNLMTNVVASSRIAGWSAHILEQYANNRLIRPRAKYTGPVGRSLN